MNAASLINQTSGDFEYYTPQEIIGAARRTMGGIDLDPASSAAANERVFAKLYFTKESDGLSQHHWMVGGLASRVFMNHPFSRDGNKLWIARLITEFAMGRVAQACCITYACTSEQWFAPLLKRPQCFLIPRTNFLLPDGTVKKGVTKGSVVTYFGPNVDAFAREFESLGVVKVPYKMS